MRTAPASRCINLHGCSAWVGGRCSMHLSLWAHALSSVQHVYARAQLAGVMTVTGGDGWDAIEPLGEPMAVVFSL